eukprot:scaffold29967_cov140-Isochrysis_galbana.AAC.1
MPLGAARRRAILAGRSTDYIDRCRERRSDDGRRNRSPPLSSSAHRMSSEFTGGKPDYTSMPIFRCRAGERPTSPG